MAREALRQRRVCCGGRRACSCWGWFLLDPAGAHRGSQHWMHAPTFSLQMLHRCARPAPVNNTATRGRRPLGDKMLGDSASVSASERGRVGGGG